jgi:hypothetical protein
MFIFSTLVRSNSTGKLLASRTATTRESGAMNGPGGTLMRMTVEPYFSMRDSKYLSGPWK